MHKIFFPLGLAFLLASPSYAQTTDTTARHQESASALTLSAALALALEQNNNPDLSAARRELDAVEATIIQAGVLPNPELAVSMEDTRKATRTTTYQINQRIELGGKRGARIEAAQRARDAAGQALISKQQDLRSAVTSAFFSVMTAQEGLRLAQQSAQLADQVAQASARRVTAGKISPVEETKARVAAASARLEVVQANSDLTLARKHLASLWGNSNPRFTVAEGSAEQLPKLPAIEDLTRRTATAPALRQAQIEVSQRQALTEVERSKRIPDLNLSVGNKRDEEARRNIWVVGVSIPLPLFDRNQGNLQEALHRTEKARDELAATELRLQSEIAQAYEKLRNAHALVTTLRSDILPGAQSAYSAAGKGFELGKFNFLEVLDAQRTLFQTQAQYLRAVTDAHLAAAELDRLLGSLTSNP